VLERQGISRFYCHKFECYPRELSVSDNLTNAQRSYCMARIKGKDTGIERLVRSELHRQGLRFRKHVKELPGRPDIVFPKVKVVVFIDGDFWHGYRYPTWEHKVSEFWKRKISKNRARDQRNFRRLRATGWQVIRIWQHDLEHDLGACISRIISAVQNDVSNKLRGA
jgi:DNA mismatch endonuclease (patch repair protein)